MGKRVDTEEDVLHLTNLPTFDGLLRPSESELLLTYLTAPYLRIPLVLRHFADPQRVRALGHADIQGVLDACFFEPGPWQPPGSVVVPAEVPAPSRAHMATPAGLLLHELSNAPAPLVDAVEEILALSLELDTGRHDAPVSAGLLYAARLMTRMHAFVRFLLVESGWGREVDAGEGEKTSEKNAGGDEEASAASRGPGGWAGGSGARGVRCPSAAARPLLHAAARLRSALDDRVRPTLRRWLAAAVKDGSAKAACLLHAHLAYLHWSTPPASLDRRGAQTLLTAQAYILVNHPFVDAADATSKLRKNQGDAGFVDEGLGFAPTELFDLFQRQRAGLLTWLESNPEAADGVLEEVVRVLTLNSAGVEEHDIFGGEDRDGGKRTERTARGWFGLGKDASAESLGDASNDADAAAATKTSSASEGKVRHTDRRWVRVPGPGGVGRYIPETEAAAAAAAAGVELVPRRLVDGEASRAAASASESTPVSDDAAELGDTLGAVPLTGAAAVSAESRAAGMSYADWMRSVTTMAVEMEVNAQLGEFTVRKNRLKSLQRSVLEMPDFNAALAATLAAHAGDRHASSLVATGGRGRRHVGAGRGSELDDTGVDGGGADDESDASDDDEDDELVVHCAEVRRTEHRLWMRLVGLRHDVQLWDRDLRAPSNPFNRRYQPLFTNAQIAAGLAGAAGAVSSLAAAVGIAVGLSEGERWIAERLDPVVAGPAAGYLAGVELYLPVAQVRGPIAHLAGFAKLPDASVGGGGSADGAWGFKPGKNASADGVGDKTGADPEKEAKEAKKRDAAAEKVGALTEVVVLRDPPLVQVYRVESYGRRWRRALVFASAAAWCLADIDPDGHPALEDPSERYLLSAARLGAAASSLVISRHLTDTQGRQQFVPARHLRGLIPAAILRDYVFWQAADGDLYGDAVPTATHPRTVIHAKLVKGAGADSGDALAGVGGGGGEHAAVIRRVPIAATDALGEREPGSVGILPGEPVPEGYVPGQLTLVDLLYAPAVLGAEAEAEASGVGASSTSAKSPARAAAEALRSLARCLAAVEGLAHCLAWTAAEVDPSSHARGGGGVIGAMVGAAAAVARTAAAVTGVSAAGTLEIVAVDRVELPRLGISFAAAREGARAARPGPGPGGVRLECEEHAGLFLSARRSPALDALLAGMPHALVLEGRDGALSVLLPASAAPRPALDRAINGVPGEKKELAVVAAEEAAAVGTKGFGTDMVLDRWDHEWTKNAARGGESALRVPGARQPRGDARHDAPRRALPHPLAISRQAIRRSVQTRGFVRLRVATHARGGAIMVRVRGRGETIRARTPPPRDFVSRSPRTAHPRESLLPWEVEPELASYVATWRHVSAACRLPANEEQELLDSCSAEGMKAPLMLNRASYLYIRARAEDAAERRAADGGGVSLAGASASASVAACPLVYPETRSTAPSTRWRIVRVSRRVSLARVRSEASPGSNTRSCSTRSARSPAPPVYKRLASGSTRGASRWTARTDFRCSSSSSPAPSRSAC